MGKRKLQTLYEVFPASSADEMFEILENTIPDVILLDVNMPGVDGFHAIQQLKANPRFANIPVIFLTSIKDEDSMAKGLSLGAIDYIPKPFSVFDIQSRIDKLLGPDYEQQLKEGEELQHSKNAHRPCVVAIDDDPHILRSIQFALRYKFDVYSLVKPEKLEEFLQKINAVPELFILDLVMPIMDGYDVFLKIRETPEHQMTPIIFLTSAGTIDNVTAAVNLGASDFVVKPFEVSVLREKVTKHICKYESSISRILESGVKSSAVSHTEGST